MSDKMVTVRGLKWSFAIFIFSTLMFFFTLPIILSYLLSFSNSGVNPGMEYYGMVTACLVFIFSSAYCGFDFIGRLIMYKQQKNGE